MGTTLYIVRIEMHDGRGPMSEWCRDLRDALDHEWAQDREAYPAHSQALRYTSIPLAARDTYRCAVDAGAVTFSANSCRAGLETWFGPTLGRDWREDEDGPTEAGREIHQLLRAHGAEIVLLQIDMGMHDLDGVRCERIVECRQCSSQVLYHPPSAVEVTRIAVPEDVDWPAAAGDQLGVIVAGGKLAA